LGILTGTTREERCAEAGGEGALDAGTGAHFGGANQRGVTGQEVIGRRFTGQLGDGRQYTGQVAGQENNVLGFAGTVLDHALVDVFQRVGSAGVLRLRYVGVIRDAGNRINHHIFQYRTELDRVPDHRLVLLRQVDALGVATALDVEPHAPAPAVLVVTDQVTLRVGGQGGLAGAGQAEEQGNITVFANVGGAVHRQHVLFRQQEVLHGKHGLLHFTGVTHAGDQHFALGKLEDNAAFGVGAVTLRITLEVGGVQDLPLFLVLRVVLFRTDEQGVGKQVVPGRLRGDFHGDVMIGVGADVQVRGEAVVLGNKGFDTAPQCIKFFRIECAVDRAPVDVLAGRRLVDDETVHRRTAGAVAGVAYQGAVGRQLAFVALDGQLDQLG